LCGTGEVLSGTRVSEVVEVSDSGSRAVSVGGVARGAVEDVGKVSLRTCGSDDISATGGFYVH